ncbi:MAG: hypothetical protein AAGC44_02080 [Planctomycetota bacterium]
MPETYPADHDLLALAEDPATAVPYIPTGLSPYHLSFRRMLHRLLRVAERGNDLRVYPLGGRLVGVYGGRCFVGDQAREVAPVTSLELTSDATTHLYLDINGDIAASTAGLPADRATFIPLAEVTTDAEAVTQLTDLRGEALLQAQTAALAGITASAESINLALDGAAASVSASNLTALTAGAQSSADSLHRHVNTTQTVAGQATVGFSNLSSDPAAQVALALDLPNLLPDAVRLRIDPTTGTFQQNHQGVTYGLLGVADLGYRHHGDLTASLTDQLIGAVPVAGRVTDIVLSCGLNITSSDPTDGLTATAKVNGNVLTTTASALSSADGVGMVSTAQGDGTPATLKTDTTPDVVRGDVLTLDLDLTTSGTVSQWPRHVAVLVIVRATSAE